MQNPNNATIKQILCTAETMNFATIHIDNVQNIINQSGCWDFLENTESG